MKKGLRWKRLKSFEGQNSNDRGLKDDKHSKIWNRCLNGGFHNRRNLWITPSYEFR